MKTRKLFTTLCVSLLMVGLFSGCKKEEVPATTTFYSKWISLAIKAGSTTGSIDAPEITQEVLDKGVILVYMASSDPAISITVLPYIPMAGAISQIDYRPYLGRIQIITQDKFTLRYRYVILTGGITNARKAAIDYSDYEAVKKAYNLPD